MAKQLKKVVVPYSIQLASKFTAHISQNVHLTRFFARRKELHACDARVSRLLVHATMLARNTMRDLYVLTRISTRDRLPVHENLLTSRFMQQLLACVPLLCESIYFGGHLGSRHKLSPRLY